MGFQPTSARLVIGCSCLELPAHTIWRGDGPCVDTGGRQKRRPILFRIARSNYHTPLMFQYVISYLSEYTLLCIHESSGISLPYKFFMII